MPNDSTKPIKVLYISHAREKTGWGRAAIDNILALDTAGVDVVCRNIDLTGRHETPNELVKFERKECYDATHCVQHVLPHYLVGTDLYEKNIAYFVSETYHTNHIDWNSYLHLVDELWVPNPTMVSNLNREGIKASIVHHCCNPAKYAVDYPEISIKDIDHTFKFYCISDFNDKKNIESVVRCFHAEFDRSEPVSLILKVNKYGKSEEWLKKQVENLCGSIKSRARLYNRLEDYHKELIITGRSSEDQIMALHQYGDCFLNFSHGEAWSIPAFDAMAFGKTPITPWLSGPSTFIKNIEGQEYDLGATIPTVHTVCDSVDAAFPDLFTAKDYWSQIDESKAMVQMRYYYENRKDRRSIGLKEAKKFSYENIGNRMKELLES